MTRRDRGCAIALGLALAAIVAWALLYHECASGGAMGGWYKTCTCRGMERIDYDSTASDGPLRTVCLGWVTARTCYRSRGGVEMRCEEIAE